MTRPSALQDRGGRVNTPPIVTSTPPPAPLPPSPRQFATLGYGDLTPFNTVEVVFTVLFVTVNIGTWAYVLGTITLLVTKQDEEIGK